MALPDQIDFSGDAIEAASHWYSGQGDMLYAVSSVGALRRGTESYREDRDDDTWLYDLAGACSRSAKSALHEAERQLGEIEGKLAEAEQDDKNSDYGSEYSDKEILAMEDEVESLQSDMDGLQEIVSECEDFMKRYEKERG